MTTWMLQPDRKLSRVEASDLGKSKTCLGCGSLLLRMAEREPAPIYRWVPRGYCCSKCHIVYVVN